jgi:hypothetical protein
MGATALSELEIIHVPLQETCSAPSCGKPLRSSGATLCATHYARMKRIGSLDLPKRQRLSSSGYRLAVGCKEYEHRVVLLAVIGPEPHPCHWCNRMLTWGVDLQVDHLDNDKLNNDPHNLLPSCRACNVARSDWVSRLTACKRGHPYTPDNTRFWQQDGGNRRECRECHLINGRKRALQRQPSGIGPKRGRRPVGDEYERRQTLLARTGEAENQCPSCWSWCRDGKRVGHHRKGCELSKVRSRAGK